MKMLRRTMKRWCCFFTCLTTRAVHIEVVRSLDADSCMAAIVRFTSRRGKPKTIVSDNGSNFVGPLGSFGNILTRGTKVKLEKVWHRKDFFGNSTLPVPLILEVFGNAWYGAARKLCLLFWVPDP